MSFADSLRRLRASANQQHRGMSSEDCIVDRDDLLELLRHFDRLDFEARSRHDAEKGGN